MAVKPLEKLSSSFSHLIAKVRRREEPASPREPASEPDRGAAPRSAPARLPERARPTRREPDIPLDVIGETYTPTHASAKTSFRSDGSDHHRDQEFATGAADTRWNDEDRITNKSGDPRIGTHGRTYEPEER